MSVIGAVPPEHDGPMTRGYVLEQLGVARDNLSSIASSIRAARENARRAREIVSTELWECLNTTSARLPRRLQSEKAHEYFKWVRERAALAVGVVEASTSRDEAWQFFALGRAIERADMTARLLATRALTEASGPSWTTILRSCGGYEPYLRTYRGMPSAVNAAEFLLLDRLFPRSVIASITTAEQCMSAIEPVADRVGHSNAVLRAFGKLRNELEYTPIEEIIGDLHEHMENVQIVTREASEAIGRRFFPTQAEPSWIGETS
ncbi:alpha-E domain-containing protein [Microbacterium gilvum]|uniref:Alpha-E domain-containing protein n=2 Tax=Microbacterium gilvum TaxID=1336204 RepID=A0ABP9AP26_9MICO